MNEFKFFVITDTHFFKNSLGAYGDGYEKFMQTEQKCYAETEAINRAAFKYLEESKEADTIIVAGDLTYFGEKESHLELKKMFGQLRDSGKKIYLVTAGHDVHKKPFAFPGTDEKVFLEGIEFDDIYDLYSDFGYSQAIELNRKHMSYVVQLADGIRLLVICNDTAKATNVPYDKEFLDWIKVQLDKARNDGQMMIAMEHYPLIAGQPILSLIKDARQNNAKKIIDLLADNGCHLIFTGHMHNQSINEETTALGNKFYDVCTGSVIGCPAFMRLCTVKDESTVEIKSIPVPDYDWDKKGLTGEEYLKKQFDSMIINLIVGAKDNPAITLRKINMKDSKAAEEIIRRLGTVIGNATIGGAGKLFGIKPDESIKNNSFLELMTDVVRNVFCGDQPFTENTPEGKFLLTLVRRFRPLISVLNKKMHDSQGADIDLFEMIKHSLGNYGISDYDAVLKLK